MEHPSFTFTLVSTRSNAYKFESLEQAREFAKDIKMVSLPGADDTGKLWVVKVGPWMYVKDVEPREQTFSASRGRNKILPWTPYLLSRLGHDKDSIIATALGCTTQAVGVKRRLLGISTGFSNAIVWTTEMLAMLGSDLDSVVASKLGISHYAVWKHRLSRGIPAGGHNNKPKERIED